MNDQPAPPRAGRRAGFTLIELMIAVVITGLAFVGIFSLIHVGVDSQIFVREMSDAEQVGPSILSQMADDLRNAYYYNISENDCFDGVQVEAGGGRTDQIHFVTTRNSLLADPDLTPEGGDEVFSPLAEVSYICKKTGGAEFFELHRREQNFVDKDPYKGGYFRMISDRIRSIKIQYAGWDLGGDEEEENASPLARARARRGNNPESNQPRNDGTDDRRQEGNQNPAGTDPAAEGEEEAATLVWEDSWNAKAKGALPVAVKIELVVSPDVDPQVMRRMARTNTIDFLDKSYVQVILLPQFRETAEMMGATYAWDGSFREPAPPGRAGGARGAGGRPGDPRNPQGGQQGNVQGLPIQGAGGRPGGAGASNAFLDALRGGAKKN